LTRKSNDPVPVETRLQLVLAVLAHETTVAEAARRHGVSTESIDRWRNPFVDAGKAAMVDGMPSKAGARGSLVERGAVTLSTELSTPRVTVPVSRGSAVLDQVVDGLGVFVEGVRAVNPALTHRVVLHNLHRQSTPALPGGEHEAEPHLH
jgi:transposase-like protein